MSTITIEKSKHGEGFEDYYLSDERLSLKAKGLLTQLKKLAVGCTFKLSDFADFNTDGVKSIRSATKELLKIGYLFKDQTRNGIGQMLAPTYYLYEIPLDNNPTLEDCEYDILELDYDEYDFDDDDSDGTETTDPPEIKGATENNPENLEMAYELIDLLLQKIATLELRKEKANETIEKTFKDIVEVVFEVIEFHKDQ